MFPFIATSLLPLSFRIFASDAMNALALHSINPNKLTAITDEFPLHRTVNKWFTTSSSSLSWHHFFSLVVVVVLGILMCFLFGKIVFVGILLKSRANSQPNKKSAQSVRWQIHTMLQNLNRCKTWWRRNKCPSYLRVAELCKTPCIDVAFFHNIATCIYTFFISNRVSYVVYVSTPHCQPSIITLLPLPFYLFQSLEARFLLTCFLEKIPYLVWKFAWCQFLYIFILNENNRFSV